MVQLTLQLGAALVIPFSAPRQFGGFGPKWRGTPCSTGRHSFAGRLIRLPLLAAAVLLAGCANMIPVPTTVVTPGMPNPEEALRESIHHVDAEMAELGQLSPTVTQTLDPVVPEDLQRPVSFDWNGPLDMGVAKLAATIGYTFYTSGPPDQQPLTVTIRMSSVPVYRVLQALGEEVGTRATVEVDPLHHQVQVIHHV